MADKKCMKCENKLATIRYKDTKWYCTLCYIKLFHDVDNFAKNLLTAKIRSLKEIVFSES
jgi:ribosomal protein L37AE/L43A